MIIPGGFFFGCALKEVGNINYVNKYSSFAIGA